MWFGDLVTLRWWDDIWLNESFAELMGWWVAVRATPYTGAWTTFAVWRKAQGYLADQRPSTHPVAPTDVRDVASAMQNLDGISYAKGASTLRQLVAWLGEDAFLAGLRDFLTAHSFGNATLADLLAALSQSCGRDLSAWADGWLRRAGVNLLEPEVELDASGNFASVTIRQSASARQPTLRPHRIGIGVYGGADADGNVGPLTLAHRVEVDLDPAADGGRTPVPELTGVHAGQLLLLNDGDLTFAKVRFDPASQRALAETLPRIADPLARAVVWSAAADSTRDAQTSPARCVALAVAALPCEADVSLFEEMLRFTRETVAERFLTGQARTDALAALHDVCARTLAQAPPGSNHQLAAAHGLVLCASRAAVASLAGWLSEADVPDGLSVDAKLRWTLLRRLVVHGHAGPAEIAAESARDRSGQGEEEAARCRAAIGDPDAKAAAWNLIVADELASARIVEATAAGFWQPEQAELTAPYVGRYFADMPVMAQWRGPVAVVQAGQAAYPRFAVSPGTLDLAHTMLSRTDLNVLLRRVVVDLTDDLRRAVEVRARFD
jgi:aminopeptidase N